MIHLECDNDEALVLALGKSRRQVSHHAGKGRISKALSESGRAEDIGLIDQDPGQPPPKYLREFKVVEAKPALGLILSRHPAQGKHLIEIQPDLEPWLYKLGKAISVKPTDHRLPESYSELHQNAKKHREHLIAYLKACLQANSPHLTTLVQWLR